MKIYDILLKSKAFESLGSGFVISGKKKKCVLFWTWLMGTPFLHKLDQLGPRWVKNDKKGFLHTSHRSANPVLPKKEVLNNHTVPRL